MLIDIAPGTTSYKMDASIRDTTGAVMVGMGSNNGLTWVYHFESSNSFTTITLAAATLGSFTSGGIAAWGTISSLSSMVQLGFPDASIPSTFGQKVSHYLANGTVGSQTMFPIIFTLRGAPYDTSGRIDLGKSLGTAVTLDANNVLNVSTKYVSGTLQTARDIGASVIVDWNAIINATASKAFTASTIQSNQTFTAVNSVVTAVGVNWALVTNPTASNALTGTTISSNQSVSQATLVLTTQTASTLTTLPTIPANWLTAAGIAANALNGKGDWVTSVPSVSAILNGIWDELQINHLAAGSFGANLNAPISEIALAVWQYLLAAVGTNSGTAAATLLAAVSNTVKLPAGIGGTTTAPAFTAAMLINAPSGGSSFNTTQLQQISDASLSVPTGQTSSIFTGVIAAAVASSQGAINTVSIPYSKTGSPDTAPVATAAYLINAPTGSGGGLSGPSSVSLTFNDSSNNYVPLVEFVIVGVGSGRANSLGVAAFGLNNDTSAGYTIVANTTNSVVFPQTHLTVNGTTTATITGQATAVSPPANSNECAIEWTAYGDDGAIPKSGVRYYYRYTAGPDGISLNGGDQLLQSAGSSSLNARVVLIQSCQIAIRRGPRGTEKTITVPARSTAFLSDLDVLGNTFLVGPDV